MDERFRILRVVIAAAALLFTVKVLSVATGTDAFVAALVGTKSAVAEEKKATTTPPKTVDEAKAAPVKSDESPEAEHGAEPEAHTEQASHADTDPAAAVGNTAAVTPPPAAERNGQTLSRSEIDVLENLSKRRAELDQRARDLDLKEKLLAATEERINGRVAELKSIESSIQSLLETRDAAEEAQIASIVKVYETMKPKDAARIFEELDMAILLPVAQKMKSAKFAPVLAEMNSESAKRLTVALATHLNASAARPETGAETKPSAAPSGAQGG